MKKTVVVVNNYDVKSSKNLSNEFIQIELIPYDNIIKKYWYKSFAKGDDAIICTVIRDDETQSIRNFYHNTKYSTKHQDFIIEELKKYEV